MADQKEKKLSLYQKLLMIQKEVTAFTKDERGNNYRYTTGNQVLGKIRPLMNEYGLILKQEVLSVENERMDYKTSRGKEKSEVLTSAKQRFTWIDTDSGETDMNEWHANGMNDWDKGLGSALTYAERYFLLKYFHVPTDEDDPDARQDNQGAPSNTATNGSNGARPRVKMTPSYNGWKGAVNAVASGNYTINQIKAKYELSERDEAIMKNQVQKLMEGVNA